MFLRTISEEKERPFKNILTAVVWSGSLVFYFGTAGAAASVHRRTDAEVKTEIRSARRNQLEYVDFLSFKSNNSSPEQMKKINVQFSREKHVN